jgi:hypothetical protein
MIRVGRMEIDLHKRTISSTAGPVRSGSRAFNLLEVLIAAGGSIRRTILKLLPPPRKTVDMCGAYLRLPAVTSSCQTFGQTHQRAIRSATTENAFSSCIQHDLWNVAQFVAVHRPQLPRKERDRGPHREHCVFPLIVSVRDITQDSESFNQFPAVNA